VEKYTEKDGIAIIDERGELFPEVTEMLSLIKEYDVALFYFACLHFGEFGAGQGSEADRLQ
jgi:hypothetical protein